jgi:hypothetical protein
VNESEYKRAFIHSFIWRSRFTFFKTSRLCYVVLDYHTSHIKCVPVNQCTLPAV